MESNGKTSRRCARALTLAALGMAAFAAGCGSGDDYKNRLKPPEPINVTASISDRRVVVSPDTFGAGPIVLIVANQSSSNQDVTLQTDELGSGRPGIRQSTGPISPQDTAQLQVSVPQGTYELAVRDPKIAPARIAVGRNRPSAQNDLLQP
jgi:hypothetical protein